MNQMLLADGVCYGLCLDIAAKPHAVRGGASTEVVGSGACDAGLKGVITIHSADVPP